MPITVTVKNTSSKDMTPKFSLKQNATFRARGRTKHSGGVICKYAGDVVEKNSEKTITCALRIPPDQALSILNCDIISVEHHLKVCAMKIFSICLNAKLCKLSAHRLR